MTPRADPRLTSFSSRQEPTCSFVYPGRPPLVQPCPGRRLLNLVRARRLLLDLFRAGRRRLLNLVQVIRRLINLQPCPGRPPPVQSCLVRADGWRPAVTISIRICPGWPSPTQACQGRTQPANPCPSNPLPTQSCPGRPLSANQYSGRPPPILE